MAPLRAVAKLTHAKYGANSHAAARRTRINTRIAITINSQSATMSTRAHVIC
jgi:hypothetical protein